MTYLLEITTFYTYARYRRQLNILSQKVKNEK